MSTRSKITGFGASAALLVALVMSEGYTDRAVVPVKGDRPTVGFGSTFDEHGKPIQMGDTTNPVQALQRTLKHVQKDEAGLKACVTAPLTQYEYDTLVEHAYQYGAGVTCKSSMVRLANQGKYEESCKAYLNYRFITDEAPHEGWQAYKFDPQGQPIRWRFDCTTPGNKTCAGVGKRSVKLMKSCMGGE